MRKNLYLPDGTTEYIFNTNDFSNLICNRLGKDAAEYITELEKQADYNTQKINSDLTSYEMEFESLRSSLLEILDTLKELKKYITEAKRVDRSRIIRSINSIEREISNSI